MLLSTRFCQEISTARAIASYAVAVPSAIAAGAALYRPFAPIRRGQRGNPIARFVVRFIVIAGGALVFGFAMQLVGGPCWLAGPNRHGGYNSDPTTARDIVTMAVILGVLFAVLVPFAAKARGYDPDI